MRLPLLLLTVCLYASRASGATLLHCRQLIDVSAGQVQSSVTIVVEGTSIARIDRGYSTATSSTDQIVDLRSRTCLPGLIDMHVHLGSETSPNAQLERFQMSHVNRALRGVGFAEKTLMAGFTTVRDLGGVVSIPLRDAINRGQLRGPRIFAAGRAVGSTGGHVDPTNGMRDDLADRTTPEDGVINSPDDGRRAVRQRYKDGADLIKVAVTGGVLSFASSGDNAQFTHDEVRAIVDLAKDYGFRVAAHAHGAEGLKRAVRAGVASIEHGTYMDDEAIALMKQHGTYYVPTILAGKFVEEKSQVPGFFPEIIRKKAAEIGPLVQETFARAYKAGVKIAYGTDTGVSPHGDNAKEFQYMVQSGMPALAALRSATLDAATLLGAEKQLGTIAVGKLADVIATDADPTKDISAMTRVVFVMKAGTVYKNAAR